MAWRWVVRIVLVLTILSLMQLQTGNCNWIIEEIPQRQYGPNALAQALSAKHTQRDIVDLSKEVWKSLASAQRAAKETRYGNKDKHFSKDKKGKEQSVQDKSDKVCATIETFGPNSGIPCGLRPSNTPMFVYFSFDDATTSLNIEFYRRLFAEGRNNPNGCPIRATFFNSHDNTQYALVKELYDLGHEVASHSVSHRGPSTWWSVNATKDDWISEIVGQKNNIHERTKTYADDGIPLKAIRGMRAPFLAIGGDTQFQMLEDNEFMYDSSIPNNNKNPTWPFTLHDPKLMNGPICRSPHCPEEAHQVWEAAMNVYYLDKPGASLPCSMVDGCRPSGGRDGALKFLRNNFRRHYQHKLKVPFGINMHAAWFAFDGYIDGMDDFIKELLTYKDVYIVPIYRVIEWIKKPMTLTAMASSTFGCVDQ